MSRNLEIAKKLIEIKERVDTRYPYQMTPNQQRSIKVEIRNLMRSIELEDFFRFIVSNIVSLPYESSIKSYLESI